MLATSVRQLREIGRSWPELRRRYRDAMPELTSREAWERNIFKK